VFFFLALAEPIVALFKGGFFENNNWVSVSILSVVLVFLAYACVQLYARLRFKNTELAYQALIALEYYKVEGDKISKK